MLSGAVAEIVTLGAIVPFISIMSDPVGFLGTQGKGLWGGLFGTMSIADARLMFTLAFVVALLAAGTIRILISWLSAKYAMAIAKDLGSKVYQNMINQDYSFHLKHPSSELVGVAQKINVFASSVVIPIMQSLTAIVTSSFIVAALMVVNFTVATISIVVIVSIYLVISVLAQPVQRKNSIEISRAQSSKVRLIQEGFGGIRDIIINGLGAFYRSKFEAVEGELRRRQTVNFVLTNAPRYIVETALLVVVAVVLYFVSSGSGDLIAVLPTAAAFALGTQRLMPYMQLAYRGPALVVGNAGSTADIKKFVDLSPPKMHKEGQQSIPFERAISLVDVSFRYEGAAEDTLKSLSMCILKGEFVGITGPTGGGKSTTVDLIMGLQHPTAGDIRIDGAPLGRQNMDSWRTCIAHVSQNVFLIEGSIADNVALGVSEEEVDAERISRAVEKAELMELIRRLPEGLKTQVGEKGARLSGGERQRIGLARALYLDRPVLVLDEATSALDEDTQRKVVSNLREMGASITVISITHRTETLKGYDRTYCIEGGHLK